MNGGREVADDRGATQEGNGIESTPRPVVNTVLVDHREGSSGVLAALQTMPGIAVRVEQLKLGDYLVNNSCLFERKTLVDFAESIKDGRLFSQARRLASGLDRAAFIIEGTVQDLSRSSMRREALQGAVITLTLIYELPVLRSHNPAETARLLVYAGDQLRRHADGAVPRHGNRPKTRRRVQLRLLQGLPGIGPSRAAALLEKFERVEAVMSASVRRDAWSVCEDAQGRVWLGSTSPDIS